ncbi:MAG: inorganic phosphate transporter [Zoogloeaceae bacterium]|jgi:low-affinity inorganic phosphate transporter|nr:inorganic phosphate transporter [Zoogloeaceae bacterium]
MFDFLGGTSPWVLVSLALALLFTLSFEFINGFHDTANAVATVIYTRTMSPYRAVMVSGMFNFLGVLFGGVGVAYAIVHLLPVELLINVDTGAFGLVMVFSLLTAAIAWNLGTWFFGIPASSSHTLIGAVLGVGLANALLNDLPIVHSINWQKAIDIGLSLIFSPMMGFVLAGAILFGLKRWRPNARMHRAPELRMELKNRKHPPFWNRLVLVLSAMAVSFVHGSNDGQKGIGLIMLVLICFLPAQFVLDLGSSAYQIESTREAAHYLKRLYEKHGNDLVAPVGEAATTTNASVASAASRTTPYRCEIAHTPATIQRLLANLKGLNDYTMLAADKRIEVRRDLLCLDDGAKQLGKLQMLAPREKSDLTRLRKDLTTTTEYSPIWVTLAIALALGLGTMVGWRRVVETVGERIGKQGMTYAQGMSAQITAALAIGAANLYSLPVSTTHILSSGVAGTMVANRSGLHGGTLKNIMLAWVLTFPISMLLAAGIFWLAVQFL